MPSVRRRPLHKAGIAFAAALLVLAASSIWLLPHAASAARRAHTSTNRASAGKPYVPGEVIVGYRARPGSVTAPGSVQTQSTAAADERVIKLPRQVSVPDAIKQLRGQPGVSYVVPDYIAHAAGSFIPNDPGRSRTRGGWQQMQWNFLPGVGVNAPGAWANLIADHRPGGKGVVVAILDTGVAYRNWHQFRKAPDFTGTKFVAPYDFVANNPYPLDREGHGTFVAGVVAEATNNGYGLTGLAYGASIMPVRILDSDGTGDSTTISRGIRYAATHGAQVINLSLEFPLSVTSSDIPDIVSAIRFAHNRGAVVVAAAGNEGVGQIAYPARAPAAVSVGASTRDRCLAYYSNDGSRLDLVAPGGDADTGSLNDPNCHPDRTLPDIFQMTFPDPAFPTRFGYPSTWFGTSMAAPHVSATAALVIASGVIGRRPTPDQVLARLEATAQPLGGSKPNGSYGYGLLDAGAATASSATTARHTR